MNSRVITMRSRPQFRPLVDSVNQRTDDERNKARTQLVEAGGHIPTLFQIEGEQTNAVRRAKTYDIPTAACWENLLRRRCYDIDTVRKCPALCPRAFNYAKLDLLPTSIKLLEEHSEQRYFVTLVLPMWRVSVGNLKDVDVKRAKANLQRWLRAPGLEFIRSIGFFEISLNVELDGSRWWQLHWHGVVAGTVEPALRIALAMDRRNVKPNSKLLHIEKAENVTVCLCYATKGDFDVRQAYLQDDGRQNQTPGSAKPHETQEYQAWLQSLQVDQLLTRIGIKRVHGKLVSLQKNLPKSSR